MNEHTVRYEITDWRGVEAILECHVEPNAGPCKLGDCGHPCENWTDLKRRADGSWTHTAYDESTDSDVLHEHAPYADGGCNYLNWIDSEEEECYGGDKHAATPGAIEFTWNGDGWEWRYSDADAS